MSVHRGVAKRRIGKGKGWGLVVVAEEGIEEGTEVVRDTGRRFSVRKYRSLSTKRKRGCYQIDRYTFLAPFNFRKPNPELLVNHSCDPNLKHIGNGVWVAARRLLKGEELTCDYVVFQTNRYGDHDSYKCHCQALQCRRWLSGNDWKKKYLQKRYSGQFFISVQKLIDAELCVR